MTDTFFNRSLCGFEAPPEQVSQSSGGATARWKHLFPFRTEQLSTAAPMVLGGQPPGRVGRRRFFFDRPVSHFEVAAGLSRWQVGRVLADPELVPKMGTDESEFRQGRSRTYPGVQAAESSSIRGVLSAPITLTRGIGSAECRPTPRLTEVSGRGPSAGSRQLFSRSRNPGRRALGRAGTPRGAGAQGAAEPRSEATSPAGRKPYSPSVENSTARSRPFAALSPICLNTNTGS